MRILLDEDTPVQLVSVLRHLLPHEKVDHLRELGWKGKKDHAVLADAHNARFDAILTNDSRQLEEPIETTAIRKSGLHHIRYTQRRPGLKGLALAMGAVISSMPGIVDDLAEVTDQRLVHIHGLEPRGRYTIVDPRRDPPRYWR
ncbi:DUF5615 family PIN-like protein [Frankia sp. AgB1.9]|uniref:DUF5615 family PIN-like protein n=1 Tax=unclassified Frankia TaxID=2632575 RepID=UPI001931AB94|nr:DUF5615 family PIN-like protein [Frankia sp. AgW1.1]MBL7552769.1 DUF5615 family PIN-like protein [Frankia sp. AgB1.9]MBL7625346.1 DUF5615 family PIN-like protein [Frankia sp. AgB1.8]